MIFAALLAGGVGSRMNIEKMPKQFLPLGSRPVFMHTLEKFLLCQQFDAVFIGAHKDWVDYVRDEVNAIDPSIPVCVVAGGSDRNETIMRIADAIENEFGQSGDHIVVTHDSVRPFVKLSTIEANIRAMLEGADACDTVIAATDTIVESRDGVSIDAIPLRSDMYQGQTPQSFKVSTLKRVYHEIGEEDRSLLTDACKMYVSVGIPVQLVLGDVTNIKLTTVMDYKIAQAMLESGME